MSQPFAGTIKTLRAPAGPSNPTGVRRRVKWAKARKIRSQLRPIMHQRDVAAALGITRQAVEQIELSALAKVAGAFDGDTADLHAAGHTSPFRDAGGWR